METLDRHFRDLTQAAFARHGFAYAELLARWPAIVGEELSRHSEPERIRWPRGLSAEAHKQGGTLIVRSLPGHALELQHLVPHLIERINGFYGYGAITAVKVVQGALAAKPKAVPKTARLGARAAKALEARLAGIADERLKNALRRLGAQALSTRAPATPK